MARRSDHTRDELREMAVTAAEQLLDKKGIAALSARKVAAAIGYSVGALYLVFKNLDDLCWHINARTMERLLEALKEGEKGDPRAVLKGYARVYLSFAEALPHRWSLMFEHQAPDGILAPDWVEASIDALFSGVEQQLQLLHPKADPQAVRLAARTLWGGVHGIALLKLRGKLFLSEPDSARQMMDSLIDRYLDGWAEEV